MQNILLRFIISYLLVIDIIGTEYGYTLPDYVNC